MLGVVVLYIVGLAFVLLCIFLPVKFARKQGDVYRLRWFNRWYIYLAFLFFVQIPFAWVLMHKDIFFGFMLYRVPSGSMEPTIHVGDFIVADTRPGTTAALKNDDIVTYDKPANPDIRFVKRIVAGPRQHVVIDETGLHVDGVLQSRVHVRGLDMANATWVKFRDVELGNDEFFLMGDNRENSYDSRSDGPVRRENLHGKITTLYFSVTSSHVGSLQ